MQTATILGVELSNSTYVLGRKAVAQLFGSTLPRTITELQAVLGRFNFCAPFVPDYKRIVKPLIALLSSRSDGVWTMDHT